MQSIKALRPAPTRAGDAAIPRRPPIWVRATTRSVSRLPSTSSAAKANLLDGNSEPSLRIGSIDDPLEKEADRVADEVMRMPDRGFSLTTAHGQLSRKCACKEDEEPKILQPKAVGQVANQVPPTVHQVLRSPGQPLDSTTREFFEPRFRRDFSDVRIHTDAAASNSAHSINALGYTVGRHVVLADGQYSPETSSGRGLLAHELAHVVQQGPRPASELAAPAVTAGVVRRKPNRWQEPWDPEVISAGVGVPKPDGFACIADTDTSGSERAWGNFAGKPFEEVIEVGGARFASVCPFPCVGQPLNLRPMFWVDATHRPRPQPFDPPNLSVVVFFYPDAGDPDVVIKETSKGQYVEPGAPLDNSFGDLTFFTPDSPGNLMVSVGIADPTSGAVAVHSESIRVIRCPPTIATEPEPEVAEPEKPAKGRQTRFNIEVQDPDNAPQVYQLIDANTPLEGPGGFFPVWQDQSGAYYYLNNGRRVDLPDFSP
jgi:hypothetical protein